MKTYKVIKTNSLEELEKEVSMMLSYYWELVGGITVFRDNNGMLVYLQAMAQ